MAGRKPDDSQREQFRRYLDNSGLLDSLSKGLLGLYEKFEEEEEPGCALDYLKHQLAEPESREVEALRLELIEMKAKCEALWEENRELEAKLAQYEPPQEEQSGE